MHFRRLEAQGYKSFATKTVFEIEAGITAVVGPNGSGKSNVVDALRWVMGETQTRQLRAKRLEEVIFAGSEARASAGMAEVRLVLDNAEGWLPLEFAEVVVARRTHRSGESEFFINEQRVRLREIQELFSRSGLGSGGYALIGQGLVDEMLRLKPEERRGLIEEVAGVGQQRQKMVESRRRRGAAHEEIDRARLLVEEIEPRLRTLERQAKRARQQAELAGELQGALRRYYGREWRRLEEEGGKRGGELEGRRQERGRSAARVAEAEAALAGWSAALREARERQERAGAERQRLTAQVREIEHEAAIARQREALLGRRAEELRADRAALAEEEQTLVVEGAEEGEASSAPDGEEARAALAEAEAALRALEEEWQALRRQAQEADARVVQLRGAEAEDGERLARIEEERRELGEAAGRREQRPAALQARLESARGTGATAAATAAAAGREATEARAVREEAVQRFYQLDANLRQLEASRSERERQLARARDRLQLLRELQAESEGMNQGLRALFGSRGVPHGDESSGIPGVVGVVRHLLRAPRGLERAIEAALGDYLDAVIFESEEAATGTITLLVRDRAGRIVTLPLDRLRHLPPLALPAERGVVGVASTLVRCDEPHRALIDTLLGRTVVVEDLAAARRMVKRGLGVAVTREGELLRPNGAIVGGRVAEAGPFQRESELQSLPAAIAELERALEAGVDVEAPREEREAAQREVEAAERALEAAAAARAAALEEAAGQGADERRLRGEVAALTEEAERASARLAVLQQEETARRAAQAARAGQLAAAEETRPTEEALEAVGGRREAQAARAAEARARLRAAEGEEQAVLGARRAQAASLRRVREQGAARRTQVQEVEEELAALAAALNSQETALTAARQAREATGEADEAEGPSVASLAGEEEARRGAVLATQHGQIEAERALATAAAAAQESEAAQAHLQERMGADELMIDAGGRVVALGEASTVAGAGRGVHWGASPRGPAPGGPSPGGNGQASGGAEAETETGEEAEEEPLEKLRERIEELRGRLRWLGAVNPEAAAEFAEIKERYDHLSGQIADMEGAEQRLLAAEAELAALIKDGFEEGFAAVDREFRRVFRTMFQGGNARLALSEGEDAELAGVEIIAQPPGKRVEGLMMLSGGERALTAIALLFALLTVRPAPFCVLDEVDAALDEANVERFVAALRGMAERMQFVVITHNRRTIEQADAIYGITMGEDSASRVLSVRLADLDLPG